MLNEGINRRDKPLYKKIKEIVKEQILSGKWAVGQCIPTEKELSEKFNVSRFTVRQSLLELTREGYLYRQAGRELSCSLGKDSGTETGAQREKADWSGSGPMRSTPTPPTSSREWRARQQL